MVSKVNEENKMKQEKMDKAALPADVNASSDPFQNWTEKVVHINRCAKVVKGGRRFSFAVLVVAGNKNGMVGIGQGKSKEVSDAIRKASENAKKHLYNISLFKNTIPHETLGVSDGGRVVLKPACPGTGVIAGGAVRAVLEMIGVKDVLSKSLRSNNNTAVVHATLDALLKLRTKEEVITLKNTPADDLEA